MKAFFYSLAIVSLLCASPAAAEQQKPENAVMVAKLSDPGEVQAKKVNFRTEINEKYKYYDIRGVTPKELRRQMSRNGTKWDDGETYDALTTWEIKFRYDTTQENGKYHLTSAKVDVAIVYRFPRWTDPMDAPEKVQTRWDTYMNHLRTHETGHRDLAVATAREINDGFSTLGSFDSSDDLDKAASAFARTKLARLKKAQKDYDATTHHGETQGAVFP